MSLSEPADCDEIVSHADVALYAAKAAGKGRIKICGHDGAPIEPAPAPADTRTDER